MSTYAPKPVERELCLERMIQAVGYASVDPRAWSALVRLLADELAPGGCEIAFHPHHGRHPAIRLDALRALSEPGRGGDVAPRRSVEPASLTLASDPNGTWRITVWSRAQPAQAADDRAQALLDCLGPVLVSAFRTSRTLRLGEVPDPSILRDLWDPLRCGVLLVEPTLRLVFANMAAEDLLRTATLFRPLGHTAPVRPARREDFAALAQACEMVLGGAGGRASFPLLGARDKIFGEVNVMAAEADPFGWGGGRGAGVPRHSRLLVTLQAFETQETGEDEGELGGDPADHGDPAFRAEDAMADGAGAPH